LANLVIFSLNEYAFSATFSKVNATSQKENGITLVAWDMDVFVSSVLQPLNIELLPTDPSF
jgi:hypothetical protein